MSIGLGIRIGMGIGTIGGIDGNGIRVSISGKYSCEALKMQSMYTRYVYKSAKRSGTCIQVIFTSKSHL